MRGAQPWRTNRARVLRVSETAAEAKLWSSLRNRQLEGLKFVRQHPIGPFFADFACREEKIVVEVDGDTHGTPDQIAADLARTEVFRAAGFRVFRVHNYEVFEDVDGVLASLLELVRAGGA